MLPLCVVVVDFLTCSSEKHCVHAQIGTVSDMPNTTFLLTSHFECEFSFDVLQSAGECIWLPLWLAALDLHFIAFKEDV